MSPAIRVDSIAKCYRVDHTGQRYGRYKTLRDSLAGMATAPLRWFGRDDSVTHEDFWALKDVSFEVQPGEVVGIIGRNGAGKSTLLKILSRITKPTTGRVELRGRVGSLLEVGTGFHPELTGRENIYLNGSILGMRREEIDKQFDAIVDFSGVERFLDTPVKRYSSGMYVRLAFSVAAHLNPEILLVDEVLAVGDQAFQKKCAQRMSEVSHGGRTVFLVSHDIPMISRLSSRVIWMKDGSVHRSGSPAEVTDNYYAFASEEVSVASEVDLAARVRGGTAGSSVLQRLRLLGSRGELTTSVPAGGAISFEITFNPHGLKFDHVLRIDLCELSGAPLGQWSTLTHSAVDLSTATRGKAVCRVNRLRLVPGEYVVNVSVGDMDERLQMVRDAARFSVLPSNYFGTGKLPPRREGSMLLDGSWHAE